MANDYDQQLVIVRVANLRALLRSRNLSQNDVALSVGVTQAAVNHYLNGRAELGRHFCKKVEVAYGLPQGGLDHKDLTIPPAPMQPVYAHQVSVDGLSPIHIAVIDAFSKAARTGAINDEACVELIGRFVGMNRSHSAQ